MVKDGADWGGTYPARLDDDVFTMTLPSLEQSTPRLPTIPDTQPGTYPATEESHTQVLARTSGDRLVPTSTSPLPHASATTPVSEANTSDWPPRQTTGNVAPALPTTMAPSSLTPMARAPCSPGGAPSSSKTAAVPPAPEPPAPAAPWPAPQAPTPPPPAPLGSHSVPVHVTSADTQRGWPSANTQVCPSSQMSPAHLRSSSTGRRRFS